MHTYTITIDSAHNIMGVVSKMIESKISFKLDTRERPPNANETVTNMKVQADFDRIANLQVEAQRQVEQALYIADAKAFDAFSDKYPALAEVLIRKAETRVLARKPKAKTRARRSS